MTVRAGGAPPSGPPAVIRESLPGKYAGFASRFAAFAVDAGASAGVHLLALSAISFAARVLTGKDITWNKGDGTGASGRRAVVRTLALPLSLLLLGPGFAGILLRGPAPGPAWRHRRDGGHLLLARAGGAAARLAWVLRRAIRLPNSQPKGSTTARATADRRSGTERLLGCPR
jgi:hypothetical protein